MAERYASHGNILFAEIRSIERYVHKLEVESQASEFGKENIEKLRDLVGAMGLPSRAADTSKVFEFLEGQYLSDTKSR